MMALPVGMFISVWVPMGVPWRWGRKMRMRVTSNSANQETFIVESLESYIRATPVEDVPNKCEVDVKAAWILNLGSIRPETDD